MKISHGKRDKLKELVLYISEQSKDDCYFGLTKLNKILFLIDFNTYAMRGESLTGCKYVHRQNGPVCKELLGVLDELKSSGRAEIPEAVCYGYTQRRVQPLTGANTSLFSDEEISFISSIIAQIKSMTATQVSDWTHTLKPWQLTEEGEEIPYYSIYVLRDHPLGRAGRSWATKELAKLKESGNVP